MIERKKLKKRMLDYVDEDDIPTGYFDRLFHRIDTGELVLCTECEMELVEKGGECSICERAKEFMMKFPERF